MSYISETKSVSIIRGYVTNDKNSTQGLSFIMSLSMAALWIESLPLTAHPVTAAILTAMINETFCIYTHGILLSVWTAWGTLGTVITAHVA